MLNEYDISDWVHIDVAKIEKVVEEAAMEDYCYHLIQSELLKIDRFQKKHSKRIPALLKPSVSDWEVGMPEERNHEHQDCGRVNYSISSANGRERRHASRD